MDLDCSIALKMTKSLHSTGGHRTRVAAVTLDNMAEDAAAASERLRHILNVSVRYWGPAFVSWLSMLWNILTRKPELRWFGILPPFRLKVFLWWRGCRSCLFFRGRGCRSALTRVPLRTDERRPSLILRTAAKLGTVYIFLDTKSHLTFLPNLDMIVWSQLYYRLAWKTPFEGSCFEFFLSKGNNFANARKYQLFGEPFRLFSLSFTQISKIVLWLKCALIAILSNSISIYLPDFM